MVKFFILVLTSFFALSGCTSSQTGTQDTGEESLYAGYYKVIEDNTSFSQSSAYYTISAEMSQMSDGTYRYYIFLDDPQVAMYDVVMMAVINGTPYAENTQMMPTIGVFESTEYNLIPYQSNSEEGYVKGLILSGDCNESEIDVELLVEWNDANRNKSNREFLSFTLNTSGIVLESASENG